MGQLFPFQDVLGNEGIYLLFCEMAIPSPPAGDVALGSIAGPIDNHVGAVATLAQTSAERETDILETFLKKPFPQSMKGIFRSLLGASGSGTEKEMIRLGHEGLRLRRDILEIFELLLHKPF